MIKELSREECFVVSGGGTWSWLPQPSLRGIVRACFHGLSAGHSAYSVIYPNTKGLHAKYFPDNGPKTTWFTRPNPAGFSLELATRWPPFLGLLSAVVGALVVTGASVIMDPN